MKKIILLLAVCFFVKQSEAQICNFTYTQSGNTVTFNLPPIITIFVIDSIKWDFGDGNSLFQGAPPFTNPTHTYAAAGTYNACLNFWYHQIGSTVQLFCTSCQTITIGATGPCNASFNTTQVGSNVTFTSTSTGPGPITSHTWIFGDGTPNSTLVNPVHNYALPGTYVACHIIAGGSSTGGFTCTLCDTITIAGTVPCNASFNTSQVGSNVTFTSTSSGPGPITSHTWIFGDGTPNSTLVNPVHNYALPGTYVACHIIAGGLSTGGFTCTLCDTIIIAGTVPCNASFNTSQVGSNVTFTSTSSGPGPITSHTWIFGDGTPNSTLVNPVHNYALPGTYIACHIITGGSSTTTGFTCTSCDTIVITGSGGTPCVATANFTNSNTGLTASFTNTSTCIGCVSSSNSWNFGDGSPVSVQTNPSHTFAASGTYNVCLTVIGVDTSMTCIDTLCKTITVVGTSGTSDFYLNVLEIYPNPTNGTSYFILPNNENIKELSVIDIAGRKIKGINYTANQLNEISIDFTELQDGIYFVKVLLDNNKVVIGKVMKN